MTRTELEEDAILQELENQEQYWQEFWLPDPERKPERHASTAHIARYNYAKRKYHGE